MVIVGLGSEEAKIPISIAACKEIDILGSFRYCNTVRPLACSSGVEWGQQLDSPQRLGLAWLHAAAAS